MDNRIMKNRGARKGGILVLSALLFFCGELSDLWAYTYAYHNTTGYTIRLKVELYDGADETLRIEAGGSESITTRSLLKSWVAEASFAHHWKQVLHFTCDLLPGDHIFSVYMIEMKQDNGETTQTWNVIMDGDAQEMKQRR
jgi:hypothetical protein